MQSDRFHGANLTLIILNAPICCHTLLHKRFLSTNIHINRAVQNGSPPWHSTAFNFNSLTVALEQIFILISVNLIMLLNNQEKPPNFILRLIKFIQLFLRYHFGWVISRHKFHYFASLPSIFFFLLNCFQAWEWVTIYKLSKLYSRQIVLKFLLHPNNCCCCCYFFPFYECQCIPSTLSGFCNSSFLFARVLHSHCKAPMASACTDLAPAACLALFISFRLCKNS